MTEPDPLAAFPALLRERSPAAAAHDAALRHGVALHHDAARAVAAAVLEYADDECRVSLCVAQEMWPAAKETVLRNLRRQLAMELADHQLLPTVLPREVITQPAKSWEPLKVELVVPVRRAA